MPIESFNYLDSLNPAYPSTSDALVGGDDHIRGIKAAVKASFPNIAGAVSATHGEINTAITYSKEGTPTLANAGAKFKTNDKDGLENPSAGKVSVTAQDGSAAKQTVAEFTGSDKKLKVLGPFQAVGSYSGGTGQLVPIGGTLIWWEDTLPTEGGYAWANGGKVNVADCPVMASKTFWQARFTDSGTKILLPDLREVVPVGNSTMGATTARGILTQFTSTLLTTIGGWFGEALHALTGAENGPHVHGVFLHEDPHSHSVPSGREGIQQGTSGSPFTASAQTVTTTGSVKTNISVRDAADVGGVAQGNPNQTAPAGSGNGHNNVQPSAVVNWIIRIG